MIAKARRAVGVALSLAVSACASTPAPASPTETHADGSRAAGAHAGGAGHGAGTHAGGAGHGAGSHAGGAGHEAGSHASGSGHGATAEASAPGDPVERALDEVARIHGAAGPWAVAGYRMSEHALAKLGLARGSFDLEVVHFTPKEVRYSCIADGAAAHSGVSVGKLSLSLAPASAADVRTVYRDKRSGLSVALRPAASFRARYADTPRDKARELGREVLGLPSEQVFEEIPTK